MGILKTEMEDMYLPELRKKVNIEKLEMPYNQQLQISEMVQRAKKEKRYSIEEIKLFIESKDSLGDVMFFLSEEAIDNLIQEELNKEEDIMPVSEWLDGLYKGIYNENDGTAYFCDEYGETEATCTFDLNIDTSISRIGSYTHVKFYSK